ncbi:hypothetical protein [Consotaella salsifontis]|uniref:Uncharacterized protein n=1 Tax=Consotaella salsifontis TaxID=1365950 RepID=A0A1T4MT00_9HYPH|nr:hypothetical protein [Consotaella salsifontis]SJZ70199.1 hypothetical protein SAMN05428963_102281 [Consotaella salsifontis]
MPHDRRAAISASLGLIQITIMVFGILSAWIGGAVFDVAGGILLVVLICLALPRLSATRFGFVAVALALAASTIVIDPDWRRTLENAVGRGVFIASFFVALATLRIPSAYSPAVQRCGLYLAQQPPGRRYAALTAGGHLFALILNYGSITLLGGLVESVNQKEENAEVRAIRNRRMLLAIQRGFCTSLCWSPLAFSMAISTSVVPGASWSATAAPALVSSVILGATGWLLDTIVKPKLSTPRPAGAARRSISGSWRDLYPLLALLVILGAVTGTIEVMTGLAVTAIVMLVVPILSLLWLTLQGMGRSGTGLDHVVEYAGAYVVRDLPSYVSEVVLLVMAGVIGELGGALLAPFAAAGGLSFGALSPTVALVLVVWLIPLTGQLGMNPILAVTLLGPMLGSLTTLGIAPSVIVLAITAGWALSGATSPFTATVLLVGRLGGVPPLRVGWQWNGTFVLFGGLVLCAWIVVLNALMGA